MAKESENNKQKGPPTTSFNTFMKGINKDVAQYILPPDTYYDAQNIRIAPHHGKEGAALVNVEGNEFLAKIPCSPTVVSLTMREIIIQNPSWSVTSWSITCNIFTSNGTYTQVFTGIGGNIVAQIHQSIISANPGFFVNGLIAPNNGSLPNEIEYNYDPSQFELTLWSNSPDFLLNNASIQGGNFVTAVSIGGNICDLEIIGYTTIRDDIYLFTTNYDGGTPEAIGGPGQIWRLSYDRATFETTFVCIYNNNNVNFSKQHPIQAIGRYENEDEQGVYWTDNFNPPRKLNVASPGSMAVDTKFLDLSPVTEFQMPTLFEITIGGTLPAGTYQMAYRYKSFEGLTSNWSPLSNKVSIYGDEETDPYCNIEGGEIDLNTGDLVGDNTSKRIEWRLRDLDTSYDIIEFGAIYMKTSGYDPLLHQYFVFKTAQNNLSDITIDLTGSEQKIQLSPTEFQERVNSFERVKTISSKDNKLFLGNIVNTAFFVDFDSRSYRFKDKNCELESESDITLFIDPANLYNAGAGFTNIDEVPSEHDCINPYNDENPATNSNWFSDDQFIFQSNGNVLGGTGPNIDYKFITKELKGDEASMDPIQFQTFTGEVSGWGGLNLKLEDWFHNATTCIGYNPPPDESCLIRPNELNGATESLQVPNQTYPMNNTIENFKSSYMYSLYEGYARGETYRFGIVFYNSKGAPSFVNWIGDIKFPFSSQYDHGSGSGQFAVHKWRPTGQFKPWMDHTNNFGFRGEMWLQTLGIEFTVDLSGLDTQGLGLTGYSIVRCERKEDDKSRFGHGLSWQVHTTKQYDEGKNQIDQNNTGWSSYDDEIPAGRQIVGTWGDCSAYGLLSGMPPDEYLDIFTYRNIINQCTSVRMAKQKALLLYGPLNWVNSTSTQIYNRDYKLDFTGGDYLKIESVFCPLVNGLYAGLPELSPKGYVGIDYAVNDQSTGQWYKYYYPVTMNVGTGYSTNVGYANGLPTMDISDSILKIPLEFSTWVGDGKTIPKEADVAMSNPFVNVTNLPDTNWSMTGYGTPDHWGQCNRPRSIGGECLYTLAKDNYPVKDMLMGSELQYDKGGGRWVTDMTIARCVLGYERYVKPYGGPTFAERSRSIYILANHFYALPQVVLTGLVSEVYGGDVSVNLFDYTQQEKNWGQAAPFFDKWSAQSGSPFMPNEVTDNNIWGTLTGCVVPLEIHTANPEFRKGYHFASKGGGNNDFPDDGTFLHDEYRILDGYMAVTNIESFIPVPLDFNINEEFDTRVYYSDTKINGESSDSWAVYKVGNFHDIEGIQGPLNNLLVHQDKMYFFQDKGFGVLNINPNAIVQGVDGQALQLGTVSDGTGAFIQSYQYISNEFGSRQQWAVTKSNNSLYFFDALHKKLFRFDAEGMTPLTDIHGLSSWFEDKLKGDVLKFDNPILRAGVSATYDNRHNEALFSFHDKNINQIYEGQVVFSFPLVVLGSNIGIVMLIRPLDQCNACFDVGCPDFTVQDLTIDIYWENSYLATGTILSIVGCQGNAPEAGATQYGDVMIMLPWIEPLPLDVWNSESSVIGIGCKSAEESYTISYNEMVSGFSSFYDFHPSIYINDGKHIITPNTENYCYNNQNIWNYEYLKNNLYIHDKGSYGTFYDVTVASRITLISNEASLLTKSFDNVSFHMESLHVDGEPLSDDFDVQFDVFDRIRFYTDYQTTGWIETNTGNIYGEKNIRKVEREWQMAVSRNIMSDNPVSMDLFDIDNYDINRTFKDRLRDKYMLIDLEYNNIDSITGGAKNVKFILHYFRTFFRASAR